MRAMVKTHLISTQMVSQYQKICSGGQFTVLVLPNNNGVIVQVRNVGPSDTLRVLLHDHPANMRVQQALSDAIGVLLGARQSISSDMNLTA